MKIQVLCSVRAWWLRSLRGNPTSVMLQLGAQNLCIEYPRRIPKYLTLSLQVCEGHFMFIFSLDLQLRHPGFSRIQLYIYTNLPAVASTVAVE